MAKQFVINGIPISATSQEIKDQFPEIKIVSIPVNPETGKSRGFIIVEAEEWEEAPILNLDGTSFRYYRPDGSAVYYGPFTVKEKEEPQFRPPHNRFRG